MRGVGVSGPWTSITAIWHVTTFFKRVNVGVNPSSVANLNAMETCVLMKPCSMSGIKSAFLLHTSLTFVSEGNSVPVPDEFVVIILCDGSQ